MIKFLDLDTEESKMFMELVARNKRQLTINLEELNDLQIDTVCKLTKAIKDIPEDILIKIGTLLRE